MTGFSESNTRNGVKEWWEQSRRLLHENIKETMEIGQVDTEVLKIMRQLLDRVEIKKDKEGELL